MLADYERERKQSAKKKNAHDLFVINDIPAPAALTLFILALTLGGTVLL